MDYDKLIEHRWNYSPHNNMLSNLKIIRDAATAIETLRADLARVTAERDASVENVKHLKAVMRDEGIVVIPPKYPWERSKWNI